MVNFLHASLIRATACGWRDGVRVDDYPIAVEVRDGWLREIIADRGQPMRIVTVIDGPRFDDLWLETVVQGCRR